MTTARHPLECILPPHIVDAIIQRGTPEQRDWAIRTQRVTTQFREQRHTLAAARLAGALVGGKQRVVYSADYGTTLPGRTVRQEGQPPTGDLAVDEAYDGSGATYDLYQNVYSRNSIDGNGLRLDSTVHYQKGYDNAFWNGRQMVYGDGDEDLPPAQRLFNRFTISIDIIGHELTHGVTQYEAKLAYANQPGALNESMSDVFGVLTKQYKLGQTAAEADWLVGQGLFTSNVKGVALRSMKAPGTAYDDPILGKDPQPAHMKDYVNTIEDNGGVHINSGIPNRAFFVTATTLGGNAWDKAGRIWYVTLRDKLSITSNFQAAADLTFQAAGELFGAGSLEQQAVRTGWADVGISVGEAPPPPKGCLPTLLRFLGLGART
jgi:Zn-dependent metalloprotease